MVTTSQSRNAIATKHSDSQPLKSRRQRMQEESDYIKSIELTK
jgi:hypothetical protein